MQLTKWGSLIVLGLSFAVSAGAANALAVGTSGTIDINANVSNVIDASTSANVSGNASANSNSQGNSGAQQNANVSANTATNASANVTANPVISLTRDDVAAQGTTQASVTSADTVRSNDDLSAYAHSVIQADANVSAVTLSPASVSVTYQEPAKFLGFIPVMLDTTVTVDGSGNATISHPWYAVFDTTDATGLQAKVSAATNPTVSAHANASFSAATQAQLLAEIHQAMQSSLESSVSAQGQATTSAQ
jgi:hypothetical protein